MEIEARLRLRKALGAFGGVGARRVSRWATPRVVMGLGFNWGSSRGSATVQLPEFLTSGTLFIQRYGQKSGPLTRRSFPRLSI